MNKPITVHIRWMIRRDMPEVLAIEAASFEWPLCEDELIRELRIRNVIAMVAEYGERVVGFMVYELFKTRINVVDFAVHPHFRRFGVGTAMVRKLTSKLSSDRRSSIVLQIRETNLDGQKFWRAMGFRAVGIVRDAYEQTSEDAYEFRYRYKAMEQVV